jgi:hypothetical protein
MTGRVEHDSDSLLGLEVGEGGSCMKGMRHGRLEVRHVDVEMLRRVLPAGLCRPDRLSPLLLIFEVQGRLGGPLGRTDLRPAVLRRMPRSRSAVVTGRPSNRE